jgi:broad specificity phosphatase PhoE
VRGYTRPVAYRCTDMSVLLLLRHGQASLGASNYDRLSDIGYQQAELTGSRLASTYLKVDHAVSGALIRQRETATAVLTEIGLGKSELTVDDRLDEYDHAGVMAGHPSDVSFATATTPEAARAVQSALDEAIGHWMAADSGYGETHDGFLDRVTTSVDELTRSSGTTLVVTSAGVIAIVCARLLGLRVEEWPALARVMVNASLTKVISGRTGQRLLTFNDHAHLEHDRALITYR